MTVSYIDKVKYEEVLNHLHDLKKKKRKRKKNKTVGHTLRQVVLA